MKRLRLALYGRNGHQLDAEALAGLPVDVVAACGTDPARTPPGAAACASLAELLATGPDAVCLCSPRRSDQGRDALKALEAGCHVLVEKPGATGQADLRRLVGTAARRGLALAELGFCGFDEPWRTLARAVGDGAVGRVRQVFIQKSYPDAPWRPVDESLDGGILLQCAIHALRMGEWTTGRRIVRISATQSPRGGPDEHRRLVAAATVAAELDGGGQLLVLANYLNPTGTGRWGHETVRLFGDAGLLEAEPGDGRVWLVDAARHPIPAPDAPSDHLARVFLALLDGTPPPLSLEDAFHPTLAAILARRSAASGGRWMPVPRLLDDGGAAP